MGNFWKILWVFTLAVMIMQLLVCYPELPERMATHFDFKGNPDGWSSKSTFLIIWLVIIIVVNMWLPLTGVIIRKGPRWMLNIPNKDYWFANEQNIARLSKIMDNLMAMIFATINIIFIYIFHYSYEINTKGSTSLKMWLIFIPIGLVTIVPLLYMLKKLKIPPGSNQPPARP